MATKPDQSKEVYDRALKLVAKMADLHRTAYASNTCRYEDYTEARAIADAMVDPDILKARAMRLELLSEHASEDYRRYLAEGAYDTDGDIATLVSAIKYGREQASA